MESVRIGVIGGSGLYGMPELTDVEERRIETPFGSPSDDILIGTLAGQRVAFIPRHRRGHVLTPSEVPYRANIFALKLLGVQQIISVSACGSLREDFAPGHVVIPDQLFDRTRNDRGHTFFGDGIVAHVSVADPFCAHLGATIAESVEDAGGTVHRGGAFITVEGPRFSTRAESALFRSWGMGIIGMTTSPEAFLAREAEMCYATLAHVTDYDVWHDSVEDVSVDLVVQTFRENVRLVQKTLIGVVQRLAGGVEDCTCYHALEGALMADPSRIPEATMQRLWPIVGKYYADR